MVSKKLIAQGWLPVARLNSSKSHRNPYRHGFAPGKQRENKRKEAAGPSKEMTLPDAEIWITIRLATLCSFLEQRRSAAQGLDYSPGNLIQLSRPNPNIPVCAATAIRLVASV